MKHKVTIGCFAIIVDEDNRVLLCHRRDYDLWNLPGGGLEKGESPWDCVKREVREETGLKVEVVNLVGVYSKTQKSDIVFSFECKIIGGKINLSDEADKIEYFSIDSIPKNSVPKQVERIHDFFDKHPQVLLKTQTGISSLELIKQGKL